MRTVKSITNISGQTIDFADLSLADGVTLLIDSDFAKHSDITEDGISGNYGFLLKHFTEGCISAVDQLDVSFGPENLLPTSLEISEFSKALGVMRSQ